MERTASLSPHLPERSELLNTTDVKSMNFTELSAALSEMGLPSYRAKQIYSWIHQKCALDYDEMTNLPLSLREKLKEELPLKKCTIERKQVSAEDGTVKYLFGFGGNEYAESVLMKYKYGYTICVSTQIGCKWAARSARPLWVVMSEVCFRRKSSVRYIPLSATRISESPILSSWAWVNRLIILIMLCVFLSL